MKLTTLPVGAMQCNAYILQADNGDAVVVDPGDEALRIMHALETQAAHLTAIWLTHGHFDHIGAVNELAEKYACPVIAGAEETAVLHDGNLNLSLPFLGVPMTVTPTKVYRDNDTFTFAGETVTVLHTAGHTMGGVCYHIGNFLFSGDTMFAGSYGRTDFPTGDFATLMRSLSRLKTLPPKTVVLAGHGPATTIRNEI